MLTHPRIRTEAGAPQPTDPVDLVRGSQERLMEEDIEPADRPSEECMTQTDTDTADSQNDPEQTAAFINTSDSTISSTAIQEGPITFAEVVEGFKRLSREDILNIRAIFIGLLPLFWHVLRVSFAAYLPVLSWTPRLMTTAIAPLALGIFWCMARADSVAQKTRLMSFVASASNGLILIFESWMGLYYGWLCFIDGLSPWKMGDAVSEGIWILALLSMTVFVIVNIVFSLLILFFVWDEQLDGGMPDFKDRLFSEPKEHLL